MLDEIMSASCAAQASDIHLHSGMPAIIRVRGSLSPLAGEGFSTSVLIDFLSIVVSEDTRKSFLGGQEIDCAFSSSHGRWRLHAYHAERGVGIALRRLPKCVPSVEKLGLPQVVRDLVRRRQGLVLVTGATGSGKTTTAAAMLNLISHSQACHIVTIEDPIEYILTSAQGVVSQREVGRHTSSFSQALRAALREDPDVIFVGEMRDLETMHLALQAAETGHLVISTLHTMGAAKAVSRVVDVFPSDQQPLVRSVLADTLEGVVSQELVPGVSGELALVPEVLIGTPAVRSLIREGKFHQLEHVMQTSLDVGMQTRARSLAVMRSHGSLASGKET
jgi:twitching motility protein PilT